jgi:hypothetical protein
VFSGPSSYFFFDGDLLPQGNIQIPCEGMDESQCLDAVRQRGSDRCYIVAVYGEGPIEGTELSRQLSTSGIVGFLGKTSCPGMTFEAFRRFTARMSLPLACSIQGTRFKKGSFGFIADEHLRGLGFDLL